MKVDRRVCRRHSRGQLELPDIGVPLLNSLEDGLEVSKHTESNYIGAKRQLRYMNLAIDDKKRYT